MLKLLLFLGILLSIVKANGWIVVPTFCVAFCWIMSIFGWFIYAYSAGVANEAIKAAQRKEQIEKQSKSV